MSPKKISVLIPVLNGERYLERCIQSLLAQDTALHEIIIVDNNSTDATKEIILSFQKNAPNIKYVFEAIRTRGAARNAGIKEVSGDIVVMTDVDCVVPKHWARTLSEPIVKGQELVVTGYQYNLLPDSYWARETQRKCDFFLNYKTSDTGYISFTDTKNLAIQTTLLKEVGFDARFKALEDVDFEIRLRPLARFYFLPDLKVGHAHSQSARQVWNLAYERSYWHSQLYHKFKGAYDIHGHRIFSDIPPVWFYLDLLKINLYALRAQGLRHTLFFIVFDGAWKLGSAVGFTKIDKSMR